MLPFVVKQLIIRGVAGMKIMNLVILKALLANDKAGNWEGRVLIRMVSSDALVVRTKKSGWAPRITKRAFA